MSGISSIPPLLCSTPPPMDFGDEEEEDGDSVLPNELSLDDEDGGEYNDFAVTSQSQDNGINPDVPSLPGTPVRLNFNELSATRENADMPPIPIAASTKTPIKPVEAFNLAISTAMLGSNSPPPLEFDAVAIAEHQYVDNEEEEEDFQDFCIAPTIDSDPGSGIETTNEEEDSLKNEDNVSLPSLKFDTLSISSDKLSACSPTSPSLLHEKNVDQNETKDQALHMTQDEDSCSLPYEISNLPHGMVKMEDIIDDASDDDTHSPKMTNKINTAENTIDFFAIHAISADHKDINILDTPSKETLTTEAVGESDNNLEITSSTRDLDKEAEDDEDDFDNFRDFTDYQTPISDTVQLTSTNIYQNEEVAMQAQSFEFDADFGEFVTTPEHQLKDTDVKQLDTLKTNDETFNSFDEDDFEDFQDFTAAPSVHQTESQTRAETVESLSQADDTEDEFGDFSDVPVTAATIATIESSTSSYNISTAEVVSKNSLDDKLKPILDMMFPSLNEDTLANAENTKLKCTEPESSVCLKLDSIDTAKALDYQWTKSEVRHSLIRSLGIDSRNILFGDKWNSSMPRFAACLQPLEPLKPQKVSQHTSSIVDAAHSNSIDRAGKTLKPDVPAVEFDWNSSGLVNPLDGPQEIAHPREAETIHTSQLGAADAPIDQQPSHSTNTTNNSDGKLADNANNNATAATSTVINTAATTTLSPTLSTDGISHNINDNGYNVDIGVNDLSRNSMTNVAVNSITKATLTNTTATDIPYNLATTCSNNTDVHEILHDEVVATSTFAGPLKETHIYTPSKIDAAALSATKSAIISTTKTTAAIDFDYEIAAAGIIIDETVVKKEYRDVEYNPGFSTDFIKTQPIDLLTSTDKSTLNDDIFGPLQFEAVKSEEPIKLQNTDSTKATPAADEVEFDDEFSDFQSVPPSSVISVVNVTAQSSGQVSQTAGLRTKELVSANNASRTSTPTFGGREMILSPAILLPQAISMESNKPKIEWGDTTANINPEELARIEELFPQPKTDSANFHKSAPIPNGYQQQQQQQKPHKSLSISAAIAQKELHVDDDDWSEFVSVPAQPEILAKPKPQAQYIPANNNNQFSIHALAHRQQQRQQTTPFAAQKPKTNDVTASSADEEWSEFVSSAPPQHPTQYRAMPQFNSAAWKNANFYNNPLSFYQSQTQIQTHSNVMPKLNHHNNNSNTHLNYNNNYNKYNQQQQHQLQHNQHAQQLQLQQKIHIMQDFSTAPPSPHRSSNAALVPNHHSSNAQFQVGSAKVAPSISLIPDLGFIAPAATTHTAFINTLPKPSLITKK